MSDAAVETSRVLDHTLASALEKARASSPDDAEFLRWLEEEYTPVAGGWHY